MYFPEKSIIYPHHYITSDIRKHGYWHQNKNSCLVPCKRVWICRQRGSFKVSLASYYTDLRKNCTIVPTLEYQFGFYNEAWMDTWNIIYDFFCYHLLPRILDNILSQKCFLLLCLEPWKLQHELFMCIVTFSANSGGESSKVLN